MFHFHLVINLITMEIYFGQLQIYTEQILFVWFVSRRVTLFCFMNLCLYSSVAKLEQKTIIEYKLLF